MKKIILMWHPQRLKYTRVDMHNAVGVVAARSNGYQYAGPAKVATMTECSEYREEFARVYGSKKV
jgi:hypothetical protein